MKISIFSIPEVTLGKHNVKDSRLDEVYKIAQSKKETYIQVELVSDDAALDADAILTLKDACTDLFLKDLEFVETRLSRTTDESEKILLNKLKNILEKEEFIFNTSFSEEERKAMSGYGLLTNKPVIATEKQKLDNPDILLLRCLCESGFISFFTTVGEKETRAWLIKKGTTAWEAAGIVHSDIQKGFIRAEIISFTDLIQSGGQTQAKQAGKVRLEQKDYVMQDGELVNFRFNR
jgi:ribosome-binding ATPase YchF (GTP1/OBG family)